VGARGIESGLGKGDPELVADGLEAHVAGIEGLYKVLEVGLGFGQLEHLLYTLAVLGLLAGAVCGGHVSTSTRVDTAVSTSSSKWVRLTCAGIIVRAPEGLLTLADDGRARLADSADGLLTIRDRPGKPRKHAELRGLLTLLTAC
jgi:hypothetical protein